MIAGSSLFSAPTLGFHAKVICTSASTLQTSLSACVTAAGWVTTQALVVLAQCEMLAGSSVVCVSLVQLHLRYSSAPCPFPAWAREALLERSQQAAAAQGDGALLGAGCSQRFRSDVSGDVASPAFSDHELPRSLPCLEQLPSVEFLFAFPGPPHQAAPRAACSPCSCC